MYHPIKPGPLLFADDNLTPLFIHTIQKFTRFRSTYDQYHEVSGLNININKSMAICINTSERLIQQLNNEGIQTPDSMRYLGIQLSKDIITTAKLTMAAANLKATKRRIMATTRPTDMLHRSTLINVAFLPIYNHIFMSIPIPTPTLDDIEKEILTFQWTKQQEGVTIEKRKLVSKKRVFSSIEVGGLQVNHPKMIMDG